MRTLLRSSDTSLWLTGGVILISLIAGLIVSLPGWQLLPLLAVGTGLIVSLSRLSFSGLLVALIWMTSLVHLLKRAIFLLGPQPQVIYYSVLLLPTAILLLCVMVAVPRVGPGWLTRSSHSLMLLLVWSLAVTLAPSAEVPLSARVAAIHERILPMVAFYIGLAAPLGSKHFASASRALALSAALSVGYGALLFISGPTAMETAWAQATASYSIQGRKTLTVLEGAAGPEEWRGFSYYADPLTWGLFLVAAIGATMARKHLSEYPMRSRESTYLVSILVGGLVLCMTRTPWIGLITMTAVFALLAWRPARKASVLFALIAAGFPLVVSVGTFLYVQVYPSIAHLVIESAMLRRYLTLGTLEARIGAWARLQESVSSHAIFGAGWGYSELFTRSPFGLPPADPGAHNFVVEAVVCAGVPGLILLIAFILTLLLDGARAMEKGASPSAARWLLSLLIGYIVTGYINGGTFMNFYFFLLAGALVSSSSLARNQNREPQG